ncbi:MAG: hypothetical protein CL676_00420 [Bdellovibrionaceae bacterium]|nr:hypothetical protein [Pseudobdellovibrionaceae bacterium]|tara:strand:+ start:4377 stop:5282 length:906 start_codon:yes stop_codon:yes gene_type:complete
MFKSQLRKKTLTALFASSLMIPAMSFASISPLAGTDQETALNLEESIRFSDLSESASFQAFSALGNGVNLPEQVEVQLDQGDQLALVQKIVNDLEESESMIEISVLKRDGTQTTYFVEEQELAEGLTSSSVADGEKATRIEQLMSQEVAGGSIQPVKGKITSRVGMRRGRMHYGTDYGVRVGTPVKATAAGKVSSAYRSSSYGLIVELVHSNGYITRYAHLSRISVSCGQSVSAGKLVGLSGNTGRSTGPHLHYEKRKVRPLNKCGGSIKGSGKKKKSSKRSSKRSSVKSKDPNLNWQRGR